MIPYALTIFLSAFLLFQLQPLIGKHILPWFGGSPAVWTTCLLFFQTVLLGGYLYAHWVASWKNIRIQTLIHGVLLLGTLLSLPVLPDPGWKPGGVESPTWQILGLLVVTVGGPYFLLSTTGPLLQAWFHITHSGRSPYRLYALSNAGSLLGLILYPFIVEPLLSRNAQAFTWSATYLVFLSSCGWCALQVGRTRATRAMSNMAHRFEVPPSQSRASLFTEVSLRAHRPNENHTVSQAGRREDTNEIASPGIQDFLSWVLMAACGSTLLMATTNQMCQNLIVIPFLWVLPLSLYLMTFIIAFEGNNRYRRVWCMPVFGVSSLSIPVVLRFETEIGILLPLLIYSTALFAGCMVCHGELERSKPAPRYLTGFFVAVAAGGALGGIFVTLAAPILFPSYWELYVALAGAGVLALARLFFDPQSPLGGGRPVWAWCLIVAAFVGLVGSLMNAAAYEEQGSLAGSRSFYGVLHITQWEDEEKGIYREMYHGSVVHGTQFAETPLRGQATSYYGEGTGGWLALNDHPRRIAREPLRIGVVGLGAGTMAALARDGDLIRFYEINPDVVRMSDEWFWYLRDTPARTEVVLGDARIQLERELAFGQEQQFDVLVGDAFNSGSIPMHLLTEECAQIYRKHLKDDGILAVHISANYFDLIPVSLGLAETLGWEAVVIDSDEKEYGAVWAATWVLITANHEFLESPMIQAARIRWEDNPPVPLKWTDDYSSLFHVLKLM